MVSDASETLLVDGRAALPQGSANQGDSFAFVDGQYQYNLKLRDQGIGSGIWTLTIKVSDGATHTFTLTVC